MDLKDKASEGYVLGYIKFKNQIDPYLMPIAYWILNYKKYDPSFNPNDDGFIFRNNIAMVDDHNIDKYIKAIEVDKVNVNDSEVFTVFEPHFYIDFNRKLFVGSFYEIELDDYLPNKLWKFIHDDPRKYIQFDRPDN